MKNLIIVATITLASAFSFADQCAFISKSQAKKAVKILLDAKSVKSLCEPCGETNPEAIKVESLGLRKAGYENYSEVVINDKGIDLAYTYVNGKNLAMLAGCPVEGVSPTLE